MTYKLVIFDFDGTLADSAAWAAGVINQLARRHGFRELSDAEITMLRGRSSQEIVRYMRPPGWKLPAIAADFRRRMAADAEAFALFDGILALLQSLKRAGLTVAVVSSNSEANVRRILGPEAAATVDAYDCGAGLFGKAAKFRALIKRRGVSPAETICIGDETRDIEAAKAAGAAAGAVQWGYATPEVLARFGPALTFAAPEEIARALIGA
ncbi:MAG: HAD hydrolase-like protein [Pseudomonadota bacterium]|nr:HAD hydrolase-like protein [Pseudomonadota bacterium]